MEERLCNNLSAIIDGIRVIDGAIREVDAPCDSSIGNEVGGIGSDSVQPQAANDVAVRRDVLRE